MFAILSSLQVGQDKNFKSVNHPNPIYMNNYVYRVGLWMCVDILLMWVDQCWWKANDADAMALGFTPSNTTKHLGQAMGRALQWCLVCPLSLPLSWGAKAVPGLWRRSYICDLWDPGQCVISSPLSRELGKGDKAQAAKGLWRPADLCSPCATGHAPFPCHSDDRGRECGLPMDFGDPTGGERGCQGLWNSGLWHHCNISAGTEPFCPPPLGWCHSAVLVRPQAATHQLSTWINGWIEQTLIYKGSQPCMMQCWLQINSFRRLNERFV